MEAIAKKSPLLILGVVSSGRNLQILAILLEGAKNARNAGILSALSREVFGHPCFREENL
jgi:hypothetical protein